MNQESLAECIYPHKWYNPFPKFKFSERPDAAAASILEGNIVILVDNSPAAMILPSSIFDIIEEADDYYFPPVTGTYLRLSRMTISILTLILTPLWLAFLQNPDTIPPGWTLSASPIRRMFRYFSSFFCWNLPSTDCAWRPSIRQVC